MYTMESCLPYVLTGSIFYGFGIKWCYEYAKFWISLRPKENESMTKGVRFWKKCKRVFTNHPIEGSLKLIATAIGLSGTLTSGLSSVGVVSHKVVHATMYLFFAFSGLVDVLNFYFPHNVSDGLVKMALAQSFFVEGFLFIWANVDESSAVNIILAARVALAFSWHVAAASAITLCIVCITRSCAPKLVVEEPPEIPIYDYCQEPDQRI
ncbi:transmembrane protein 45B-like [Vespula squamosa]|uniref:Transmembrane protein 45B-like n=1 Tax=Vespula squamosa TaxID=30214 RepID=A0ABD2A5E4_VESSQ